MLTQRGFCLSNTERLNLKSLILVSIINTVKGAVYIYILIRKTKV